MVTSLDTLVLKDTCEYDEIYSIEENVAAVLELKNQKNALLLCHTYQRPEIRHVSDVVGDSYGLSKAAMETDNEIIVFNGVHFMAETAKILNPGKRVLLPTLDAGCGLADTIDAEKARAWKAEHPGLEMVLYINSSADVKAEADIICTSSNTLSAIEACEGDTVLMAPDKNLYYNFQPRTSKTLIPWEGYCPVHLLMGRDMLELAIEQHPAAEIVVHPECNPDVTELADVVLSTSGMVEHVRGSDQSEFIIGTEEGLIRMLIEMFPDKTFYGIAEKRSSCDEMCSCPYMKAVTIGKLRRSLETETHEIDVAPDVREKALVAIQRMIDIGRDN